MLLRRYVQSTATIAEEWCELCSEPISPRHGHVLEVASGELRCVCRPCAILFDKEAASQRKYRLVPDRRLALDGVAVTEGEWESLGVPVDLVFFVHSTPAGRAVAFYPGPMGPTESQLRLSGWHTLVERHPVLATLEPDVEAFLVNRARGAEQYFLVPIEDCYRLVALMRQHWHGLSGGKAVWREVSQFFEDLTRRSKTMPSAA